jgi:hypothetical protein
MPEPSKPQMIADEYLGDGKPSLQHQNALTLLRVIGGGQNAERIAQEAVSNVDQDVRKRAVLELSELNSEDRSTALKRLRATIDDRASATQSLRAYVALGAMREATRGSVSLLRKARLEFLLFREVNELHGVRFHARTLVPTGIAAATAAVLMLLYLSAIGLMREFDPTIPAVVILLALLISTLAALVVPSRSIAFQRHINRPLGVLVECLWPIPFVFAIFGLVYLAASFTKGKGSDLDVTLYGSFIFPFLVLALTVCAIRAGTILWFADKELGNLNLVIQTLLGGSLGAVAFTALLWSRPATAIAGLWATLVPVCFGMAAAFAAVEAEGPNDRGARSAWRPGVGALVMLAFGVVLWLPFANRKSATLEISTESPRSVTINYLPETVYFSITEKSRIYFRAAVDQTDTTSDNGQFDLDANLAGTSGNASGSDSPPILLRNRLPAGTLVRDLIPGKYSVFIWDTRRPWDSSQERIFPELYGAQGRWRAIPKVTAKLMLARWSKKTFQQTNPPDVRTIPIPYTPFIRFMNVSSDDQIMYASLQSDSWLAIPFSLTLYRNGDLQPVWSNNTSIGQVPTFEQSVGRGDYFIVVDQGPGSFQPPGKNQAFESQSVAIPPGFSFTAASIGLTKDVPGKQGKTVFDADDASPAHIVVPSLPFIHLINVVGKQRTVYMFDEDKSDGANLQLFNEAGTLIGADTNRPSIRRPLTPGLYWLVASRGDRADVSMSPNGKVDLGHEPQPVKGVNLLIYLGR